jgi:tetratricopeptide (TPR) repeat protein
VLICGVSRPVVTSSKTASTRGVVDLCVADELNGCINYVCNTPLRASFGVHLSFCELDQGDFVEPQIVAAETEQFRVQQHHVLMLLLLTVAAVGAFLFTRFVSAREQAIDAGVAVTWYEKGEAQLRAGAIEEAIRSFRKANAGEHFNREYALGLASALAVGGHKTEALQTLMRLRESDPEDAAINLYLARLEVELGKIVEAVRFYENALYGRWSGTNVDERRRELRLELIKMLLQHEDKSRALSELLILEGDIPADAAMHSEVGRLFLSTGDAKHGLSEFQQALRLAKGNSEALLGAGEAAFNLGDYSKAREYLEGVKPSENNERGRRLLLTAQLVSSEDPLAPHVTRKERLRRLETGLARAIGRAQQCVQNRGGAGSLPQLDGDIIQAQTFGKQISALGLERNPELARSGVETISRLESATMQICGRGGEADEAVVLIGRKHGVQ